MFGRTSRRWARARIAGARRLPSSGLTGIRPSPPASDPRSSPYRTLGMLYLNSSHSACRREAQPEIDRATAMATPGLLLSVVHQRGWAGQYRGAYLAMVSPGERRCRPGSRSRWWFLFSRSSDSLSKPFDPQVTRHHLSRRTIRIEGVAPGRLYAQEYITLQDSASTLTLQRQLLRNLFT